MRISEAEVQKTISSQIRVTLQDVTLAKSYILKNFHANTDQILSRLLRDFDAQMPRAVVLHESVDLQPQVTQAIKSISWQLAFGEAIWGLLNTNILIPMDNDVHRIEPSLSWTTVVPGGGGTSSGWRFEEHAISIPAHVRLVPSMGNQTPQPLSNPDLYLADIEIPDLHKDVEESLREAVRCFRYELYIPCLAMLAKASEGAWTELGLSLLEVDPTNPSLSREKREKTREMIVSPDSSVVKRIRAVLELYDRQDVFSDVKKRSGFDNRALRGVSIWADVVRDSRNAVHYGAEPATQNTYEKVAALLLGAVQNLQIIYGIRRAAREVALASQGFEGRAS